MTDNQHVEFITHAFNHTQTKTKTISFKSKDSIHQKKLDIQTKNDKMGKKSRLRAAINHS